jgi:hypothetical protein
MQGTKVDVLASDIQFVCTAHLPTYSAKKERLAEQGWHGNNDTILHATYFMLRFICKLNPVLGNSRMPPMTITHTVLLLLLLLLWKEREREREREIYQFARKIFINFHCV